MTTFDKKEQAEEEAFVLREEREFFLRSRRNKLLSLWAGDLLDIPASDYFGVIVAADIDGGDVCLKQKLLSDFSKSGIAVGEPDLVQKIHELDEIVRQNDSTTGT